MAFLRFGKRGITFAAAILVIFIVIFVGLIAYLTAPTQTAADTTKAYFEDLNFKLDSNKLWHVGVPIKTEGNLNISLTSDGPVRVYAKYGNTYLIDKVTVGHQTLIAHVDPSMNIIEVAVVNQRNATVSINHLTCVLTQ